MVVQNGDRVSSGAAQSKIQKAELQVAETKMVSFSLGVSRMERILSGMRPLEGEQHMSVILVIKPETSRLGHGLDMSRGDTLIVSLEGC